MSDEQRKDEETEVEGHLGTSANDASAAESDEDNEVEAHVRHANLRLDAPRKS